MSLTIQPYRPEACAEVNDLYFLSSYPQRRPHGSGQIEGKGGFIARVGDQVVGATLYTYEPLWFNGRIITSCRQSLIFVRPDYHGTPLFSRLNQRLAQDLADRQVPLIYKWNNLTPLTGPGLGGQELDPTRYSLGRDIHRLIARVGMDLFTLGWQHEIGPGIVASPVSSGVRAATGQDLPALEALYARRAATLSGPVVRDRTTWQERLWGPLQDRRHRVFVHEGEAGPDGYVAVTLSGEAGSVHVEVLEWVDESPLAWRSLLQCLLSLPGPRGTVSVPPQPPDRPWQGAFDGQPVTNRPVRHHLRPGAMMPFLAMMRYQDGEGSLRLGVADPMGLWPGRVRLSWADHGLQGAETVTGAPEVRLTIGTLGLIACGHLSVKAAEYLNLVTGKPAALAQLGRIWRPQPLYRFWPDNVD